VKGILGYGRYNDDPDHVGCPRQRSDMTPCVARDGALAQADGSMCVGCDRQPVTLLQELVRATATPDGCEGQQPCFATASRWANPSMLPKVCPSCRRNPADLLQKLVREATAPLVPAADSHD
jgi:hypothetical protein